MKYFWEVLDTKPKLYTDKAYRLIVDKKTGKEYRLSEPRLFLEKEYPKKIINFFTHNGRYDFYSYPEQKPRIEKNGLFGNERRIYSGGYPTNFECSFEDTKLFYGAWRIQGLSLYTNKAVDFIRDKITGKEYPRGEMELFYEERPDILPYVEFLNRYELIYEIEAPPLGTNDYLREISTNSLCR